MATQDQSSLPSICAESSMATASSGSREDHKLTGFVEHVSTSMAAVEEAAYRGVVLDALDNTRITAPAALVLQAVALAALHFRAGFPRGLVGVGLTFA
jgi:hypothetical protein